MADKERQKSQTDRQTTGQGRQTEQTGRDRTDRQTCVMALLDTEVVGNGDAYTWALLINYTHIYTHT